MKNQTSILLYIGSAVLVLLAFLKKGFGGVSIPVLASAPSTSSTGVTSPLSVVTPPTTMSVTATPVSVVETPSVSIGGSRPVGDFGTHTIVALSPYDRIDSSPEISLSAKTFVI